MKTIEMLINELKANEDLQKLLIEAAKNNTLAAFLKEQGCEATVEEFIAAIKDQCEQLDENELNTFVGGVNTGEAVLSALTFGIVCLMETFISLAGDGVGNGTDGQLLCNNEYTFFNQ